ncbi:MAG TPA: nucleotide exchange factor GrpE [Pyrinomonadaceae bacterium]|jgi:molecular chaperone GrpE|nr:nucleotide exchange factor GrpE [Pyrinomonadaceae bacterium]
MEERQGAEAARAGREAAPEETERVRVTDRRRININTEGASGGSESGREEAPNLKPSYVEELEARTRAAEQKSADVQARFEQVRAELRRETDEIRQRLNRAADERARREQAAFINALLPVMDNLQRAVEAAEGGGSKEALLNGLHGTLNGFASALAGAGAEAVEALGEQFDPEVHEAVDTVEVGAEQDGLVTAEYSRGYRMGGQLLRPARVQVGRTRVGAIGAAE